MRGKFACGNPKAQCCFVGSINERIARAHTLTDCEKTIRHVLFLSYFLSPKDESRSVSGPTVADKQRNHDGPKNYRRDQYFHF